MRTFKFAVLSIALVISVLPLRAEDARINQAAVLNDTVNEPVNTATTLETLGQLLFFDQTLSNTGHQSCATCHDPTNGFIDARDTAANRAVSVGDDGRSFGTRNTPSITYASFGPAFSLDEDGYVGGFFLDGRAPDLAAQALEPFINPIEMALPDHKALLNRVAKNPAYAPLLEKLLGNEVVNDEAKLLSTIAEAIVTFEKSALFSTFDSKYDRYLAGEVELSPLEERGRSLFFSQLANCSQCHLRNAATVTADETFTNYRYHNIGIPSSDAVAAITATPDALPDGGLLNNPVIDDQSERGKFKVPSLRNVAVTAPYMHNGVFKELQTTVHYYNQFIVKNLSTRTNPETGEPWGPPEIADNISLDILKQGQPMDQQRIAAIVAFLKTLTDKRYEALLQ